MANKVQDENRSPVEVNDKDVVEKTDKQDRTGFENTDHVQYNLDVDPNDPRNREPARELPSLDDEATQVPKDYKGQPGSHNGKQNDNPLI